MQIHRMRKDEFLLYRMKIVDLIIESASLNFPNARIDEHYAEERCNALLRFLDDGSAVVFTAIEKEDLIGWIWCHEIDRVGEKRLHIAEIAVFKTYRSKGVGRKLLKAAESFAEDNNYKTIDLLVTSDNLEAILFYEKSSFSTERIMMKKSLL